MSIDMWVGIATLVGTVAVIGASIVTVTLESIGGLKADLDEKIDDKFSTLDKNDKVETDLKTEISAVETGLKTEIGEVKAIVVSIDRRLYDLATGRRAADRPRALTGRGRPWCTPQPSTRSPRCSRVRIRPREDGEGI